MKRLFNHAHRGELGVLLEKAERELTTAPAPQRRLTPQQIEQLLLDYKAGVGSVYVLARNCRIDRGTGSGYHRAAGPKLGRLPLTDAEVEKAVELWAEGNSFNAIGRVMMNRPGVSGDSIL